MLRQVNSYGYSFTMMKGTIDYKRDNVVSIPKRYMYVVTNRGQNNIRETTIGWKLLVKCADDSESWLALKYIK